MPRFAIGGLDLHYLDQGAGDVLLILPDNIHAASAYVQEAERWASRMRVIVMDYPDRGLSDRNGLYPDEQEYDLWGYWADLGCHLLQHLGVARCHLLGSFGGALTALHVAGQQAAQHGITPLSLVADSFLPDMDARTLHRALDRREHFYTRQRAALRAQHGDQWRVVVDADTAALRALASRGGYSVPAALLMAIPCPVLLTGSLNDPRTPGIAGQYARLAETIRHCSLHLEARGGHRYIEYPFMWSNASLFARECDQFWTCALASMS